MLSVPVKSLTRTVRAIGVTNAELEHIYDY
jgi:hypothetical protein